MQPIFVCRLFPKTIQYACELGMIYISVVAAAVQDYSCEDLSGVFWYSDIFALDF